MSTPRTWLPRTQEILAILRDMPDSHLDRTAVEKLFELQRRAALVIIQQVGAQPSGTGFKIDRKDLIRWIESIWQKEGQDLERRRLVTTNIDQGLAEHRAMQQSLRDAGKPIIEFPITKEILSSYVAGLPHGIHLTTGRIVIEFDPGNPDSALPLLYQLGTAIANDFEGFVAEVRDENKTGI